MEGKLFLDARQLAKLSNVKDFALLDIYEVVNDESETITLKLKTVTLQEEDWNTCHNFSESVSLLVEELPRMLKNDRFISGAIWVPIEEKYTELLRLLNEGRWKEISFDRDLIQKIYVNDLTNINNILDKFGRMV